MIFQYLSLPQGLGAGLCICLCKLIKDGKLLKQRTDARLSENYWKLSKHEVFEKWSLTLCYPELTRDTRVKIMDLIVQTVCFYSGQLWNLNIDRISLENVFFFQKNDAHRQLTSTYPRHPGTTISHYYSCCLQK